MSAHPAGGGLQTDAGVPGPPPGPGVAPPFAAPPTDRNRRGLWIGLGVGAVALVLCCVGGLSGLVFVLVASSQQVSQQATGVVTTYLNALRDHDARKAHAQLCQERARQIRVADLDAESRRNPIARYSLEQPRFAQAVEVDTHVTYVSGTTRLIRFELVTEGQGQDLKICGIR
jgi:hypothetical protein